MKLCIVPTNCKLFSKKKQEIVFLCLYLLLTEKSNGRGINLVFISITYVSNQINYY